MLRLFFNYFNELNRLIIQKTLHLKIQHFLFDFKLNSHGYHHKSNH